MQSCWILRIYDPKVCSCVGTTTFDIYIPLKVEDIALLYIKDHSGEVEPLCYAKVSNVDHDILDSGTYVVFTSCRAIRDPNGIVRDYVKGYARFNDAKNNVVCDEMLKKIEEAENRSYTQTSPNMIPNTSQPNPIPIATPVQSQNPPQIVYYPTTVGIIRSDGTARLSIYAPTKGRIISATIQGTPLITSNAIPLELNPGNNDVTLYFGNVSSLQVGQQYVMTIVIHSGSKFDLVNVTAVYQG